MQGGPGRCNGLLSPAAVTVTAGQQGMTGGAFPAVAYPAPPALAVRVSVPARGLRL